MGSDIYLAIHDERGNELVSVPEISKGPTFPDSIGLGPFGPNDDRARRLMLGLD